MTRGTWFILSNGSGELDRHFEPDPSVDEIDYTSVLIKVLKEKHWILAQGDSILIEEGESEQ